MNVTIDVSPAVHRRAGLGRYAGSLVKAMRELEGTQLTLSAFYAESRHARSTGLIAGLPVHTTALGYKPWRLAAMLSQFGRVPLDRLYGNPDLVHATDHLLPHLRARSVFTLHDLIFEVYPEHHKFYNHTFLSLMMPRFLRAADHIICVSHHTRADAQRLYGIPGDKMTVIHEAADPRFRPSGDPLRLEEIRERYSLPQQFILHVGTIEPRKNLSTLLEAFRLLVHEFPSLGLVLVGKKGWLYEPFFEQLRESGVLDKVIFPGFVAEEDLPALYELATVYAFPSVYEGFGLPPLEAMACGTPVVSSNRSSMPEVIGEAGLLVAPDDIHAFASALRRVLADEALRADLRARGLRQAARFSWERAARETIEVYRRVAGKGA